MRFSKESWTFKNFRAIFIIFIFLALFSLTAQDRPEAHHLDALQRGAGVPAVPRVLPVAARPAGSGVKRRMYGHVRESEEGRAPQGRVINRESRGVTLRRCWMRG